MNGPSWTRTDALTVAGGLVTLKKILQGTARIHRSTYARRCAHERFRDRSRASPWPNSPLSRCDPMNGYLLYDGMRRAIVRDILKRACSCAPLLLAGVPLTTTAQDMPAAAPAAEL